MYFDDNMPGGSIAVDIPIGEGNLAISPYADAFFKSGLKFYNAGASILIKKIDGESANFYFGGGGGFARLDVSVGGLGGALNGFAANGIAGVEFAAGESMNIFVQGKYIIAFGDLDGVRNFAAQAGISIPFGE